MDRRVEQRPIRVRWAGMLVALAVVGLGACAHAASATRADLRVARYLATAPEPPPAIAAALAQGHVVTGMDREQVTVVLGPPIRRTVYPGPPASEVWLYRRARLHEGAASAHGATLFRLVFIDGRLVIAEPL